MSCEAPSKKERKRKKIVIEDGTALNFQKIRC